MKSWIGWALNPMNGVHNREDTHLGLKYVPHNPKVQPP